VLGELEHQLSVIWPALSIQPLVPRPLIGGKSWPGHSSPEIVQSNGATVVQSSQFTISFGMCVYESSNFLIERWVSSTFLKLDHSPIQ